jgi:hypothetical protein
VSLLSLGSTQPGGCCRDIGSHAGDVSGEYPREHERRCRHRVHPRRAYRQSQVWSGQKLGRNMTKHTTATPGASFYAADIPLDSDAPAGTSPVKRGWTDLPRRSAVTSLDHHIGGLQDRRGLDSGRQAKVLDRVACDGSGDQKRACFDLD